MRKAIIGIPAAIALLIVGMLDGDAAKISGDFVVDRVRIKSVIVKLEDAPAGVPMRPQCCKQYGTWRCPCPAAK